VKKDDLVTEYGMAMNIKTDKLLLHGRDATAPEEFV
jgi:hypothetical protein